ncbi:hypothetical protein IAG15_15555, partial [Enterococcus faecalis]|nr:hypothetical protein [Enterococcus faecalis]
MNNQAKLFRTVHHAIEFDYAMIEQATEYFEDYVEKGIILTQEFASNKWLMTNEYANISFLFNVNTFQYNRYYEPLLG